jgi:hypothetical protein
LPGGDAVGVVTGDVVDRLAGGLAHVVVDHGGLGLVGDRRDVVGDGRAGDGFGQGQAVVGDGGGAV